MRCAVEGCEKVAAARGWCHGHYLRWYRNGDVQVGVPLGRRRQPESCVVDGCEREPHSRGLCRGHYKRLLRYGHEQAEIPLRVAGGEGWMRHGYFHVLVPRELRHLSGGEPEIAQHRLVMARHLGRALYADEHVHHANGISTDNRLENLELWSTSVPRGQRVDDKLTFALEILRRYRPELLSR